MTTEMLDPKDPLPLYYQLYSLLLERIRREEFHPGDMLPSERKLSREYGVSRITVIKAMELLEKEGLVERRQGRGSFVLDQARGKPPPPCERVAFLLPTFADSYITSVLIGATRVAMHHGIQLQVIGVESEDSEAVYIRQAVEQGVEGLLVFPCARYPDVSLYQDLLARHYPIVLLDRYYPNLDTDRVVFADETAGYALTELLIRRGHRRIAVFPGHEITVTSVKDRLRGYRRALQENGVSYDEDLVCLDVYENLSPVSLHQLRDSYRRFFHHMQNLRFTGIVAINMYVARQIVMDLMKIKNLLLRATVDGRMQTDVDRFAPEIVAIASQLFAHDQSSLIAFALQAGEQLGERGMLTLLARLQGSGKRLPPQHLQIPMRVIKLDEDSHPDRVNRYATDVAFGGLSI